MDFAQLKKIVNEKVISKLDHTDLNDMFKNPSAELVSVWIWKQLEHIGQTTKTDVKLVEVKLWEGDTSYVTYHGN